MEAGARFLLVYSTVPDRETGRRIARALVEERHAACVSILPGVESHYRWRENLEQAEEWQLLIKTTAPSWEKMRQRLVELHPYECPEVVAVQMVEIHPPYREWLEKNTENSGIL
jgi:periplasmic divalent cation tolerance protein